mgnify:CR=1 FL=1
MVLISKYTAAIAVTIDAPTVNAEEDWGFKGWDKEVATGEIPMEATDETYTAQYFEDKNHSGKDDEDEKITVTFLPGEHGTLEGADRIGCVGYPVTWRLRQAGT